ncbi:MAG: hypothetical protein OER88_10380 [Planctomycetota bacterium]|nr:hypothetical protein [Planctomycetota bacterium]
MLFTRIEELEQAPEADHVVGEEIDPGVTITRRQIFRIAAVAGTGALLAAPGFARETKKKKAAFGPITFDEIVAQLRPLSKQLIVEDGPNEDAYLHTIAALLARLDPIPAEKPWRNKPPFAMRSLAVYKPLVVYEIAMAPRAKIEIHDHRDYNGVLFGLKGEAGIRNFDIVGRKGIPSMKEKFDIRQSQQLQLTPGRVSTLSRTRDNIHEVVAGRKGARLLDVFTYFTKDAGSHYLDIDRKPHGKDKRLYRAKWRPRPRRK